MIKFPQPYILLSALCLMAYHPVKSQTYKLIPVNQPQPVKDTTLPEPELLAANIKAAEKETKPKEVPFANQREKFGKNFEFIKKYTKNYLSSHNRMLTRVHGKNAHRFAMIDKVLQRYGIPKELKYLAVIESAMNNRAVSPVGAVGGWQFMEGTARNFGLVVNGKRDDRTDWYKSTTAAAKFLKVLYKEMDDWLLVVASYNCGPVPVRRAFQRTGKKDFWSIKRYLPRETQNHVLAFIATATIFEKLGKEMANGKFPNDFFMTEEERKNAVVELEKELGVPRFTQEELQNMSIINLNTALSQDILINELALDRELFEKWNDDYELFELDNYDKEVYPLRLPKDKVDAYFSKKNLIEKKSKMYLSSFAQ